MTVLRKWELQILLPLFYLPPFTSPVSVDVPTSSLVAEPNTPEPFSSLLHHSPLFPGLVIKCPLMGLVAPLTPTMPVGILSPSLLRKKEEIKLWQIITELEKATLWSVGTFF